MSSLFPLTLKWQRTEPRPHPRFFDAAPFSTCFASHVLVTSQRRSGPFGVFKAIIEQISVAHFQSFFLSSSLSAEAPGLKPNAKRTAPKNAVRHLNFVMNHATPAARSARTRRLAFDQWARITALQRLL